LNLDVDNSSGVDNSNSVSGNTNDQTGSNNSTATSQNPGDSTSTTSSSEPASNKCAPEVPPAVCTDTVPENSPSSTTNEQQKTDVNPTTPESSFNSTDASDTTNAADTTGNSYDYECTRENFGWFSYIPNCCFGLCEKRGIHHLRKRPEETAEEKYQHALEREELLATMQISIFVIVIVFSLMMMFIGFLVIREQRRTIWKTMPKVMKGLLEQNAMIRATLKTGVSVGGLKTGDRITIGGLTGVSGSGTELDSIKDIEVQEDFRDRPWYVELGLNNTPAARRKWFGKSRLDPSTIITARLQEIQKSNKFLGVVAAAVRDHRLKNFPKRGMSLVERIYIECEEKKVNDKMKRKGLEIKQANWKQKMRDFVHVKLTLDEEEEEELERSKALSGTGSGIGSGTESEIQGIQNQIDSGLIYAVGSALGSGLWGATTGVSSQDGGALGTLPGSAQSHGGRTSQIFGTQPQTGGTPAAGGAESGMFGTSGQNRGTTFGSVLGGLFVNRFFGVTSSNYYNQPEAQQQVVSGHKVEKSETDMRGDIKAKNEEEEEEEVQDLEASNAADDEKTSLLGDKNYSPKQKNEPSTSPSRLLTSMFQDSVDKYHQDSENGSSPGKKSRPSRRSQSSPTKSSQTKGSPKASPTRSPLQGPHSAATDAALSEMLNYYQDKEEEKVQNIDVDNLEPSRSFSMKGAWSKDTEQSPETGPNEGVHSIQQSKKPALLTSKSTRFFDRSKSMLNKPDKDPNSSDSDVDLDQLLKKSVKLHKKEKNSLTDGVEKTDGTAGGGKDGRSSTDRKSSGTKDTAATKSWFPSMARITNAILGPQFDKEDKLKLYESVKSTGLKRIAKKKDLLAKSQKLGDLRSENLAGIRSTSAPNLNRNKDLSPTSPTKGAGGVGTVVGSNKSVSVANVFGKTSPPRGPLNVEIDTNSPIFGPVKAFNNDLLGTSQIIPENHAPNSNESDPFAELFAYIQPIQPNHQNATGNAGNAGNAQNPKNSASAALTARFLANQTGRSSGTLAVAGMNRTRDPHDRPSVGFSAVSTMLGKSKTDLPNTSKTQYSATATEKALAKHDYFIRQRSESKEFLNFCAMTSLVGTPQDKKNDHYSLEERRILSLLPEAMQRERFRDVSWRHLLRNKLFLNKPMLMDSLEDSGPPYCSWQEWAGRDIKRGAWPLRKESRFNSVGECDLLSLCFYFNRFLWKRTGMDSKKAVFWKVLMGLVPAVQAMAMGFLIAAISEAFEHHQSARKDFDAGTGSRFANHNIGTDNHTGIAGNGTEVPHNSEQFTALEDFKKDMHTQGLAELPHGLIFRVIFWILVVKLIPMFSFWLYYKFELAVPASSERHNLRQVMMSQMLKYRCHKVTNAEYEEQTDTLLATFRDSRRYDGNWATSLFEQNQNSIRSSGSNSNTLTDSFTLAKINEHSLLSHKTENMQKDLDALFESDNTPQDFNSGRITTAQDMFPPVHEPSFGTGTGSTRVPSTGATATAQKKFYIPTAEELKNMGTGSTTSVVDTESSDDLFTLPPGWSQNTDTITGSTLRRGGLGPYKTPHQTFNKWNTFQNAPGKCVTILGSFVDDAVGKVWTKSFDVVESFTKSVTTLAVIIHSLTLSTIGKTSEEKQGREPLVWLFFASFFVLVLVGQYMNYKLKWRDSIDFWSVAYKWRVNMGSYACEALTSIESNYSLFSKNKDMEVNENFNKAFGGGAGIGGGGNAVVDMSFKFGASSNLNPGSPKIGAGGGPATTTAAAPNFWDDRAKAYSMTGLIYRRRAFHAAFVGIAMHQGVGIFQLVLELGIALFIGMDVLRGRMNLGAFVTAIGALSNLNSAITNLGEYFDGLPQGYSALLWITQCVNLVPRKNKDVKIYQTEG